MLHLIAGTDIDGEGPTVWDDPNGAERVLHGAIRDKPDRVIVVSCFQGDDGIARIAVASDIETTESIIGFLVRAQNKVSRLTDQAAAQAADTFDPA